MEILFQIRFLFNYILLSHSKISNKASISSSLMGRNGSESTNPKLLRLRKYQGADGLSCDPKHKGL
jgi:hypothetical protein